jgi:hypothetical protein
MMAGIATSVSLSFIAESLEARQAALYAFEATEVSGLAFLQWSILLTIMLSCDINWVRINSFAIGIVIFYLSTYWFLEVTARIFESGLIVVLLTGLTLEGWRRRTFLVIVFSAGILAWLLRVGEPSLGFELS